MKLKPILFCLLFCFSAHLSAQSFLTDDPLEAGEALHRPAFIQPQPSSNPLTLAFNELIKYYQKNVSPNSVQRCQFSLSCSNYAKQAMQKYDFIGFAFFIDRYFFRENESLTMNYFTVRRNGMRKYDDSFYLTGGKAQ